MPEESVGSLFLVLSTTQNDNSFKSVVSEIWRLTNVIVSKGNFVNKHSKSITLHMDSRNLRKIRGQRGLREP